MQGKGQGATEYLVLLAVVLVIALVGIALLGFFPGTASDAQIAESKIYWQSAQPIAITEWDARIVNWDVPNSWTYLRFRNAGSYPIRITGIVGVDGNKAASFYAVADASCGTPTTGTYNISDFFYMAPGEERYIGWKAGVTGLPCDREMAFRAAGSAQYFVGGATSVCQNSSVAPGTVRMNSFGFEYVQYVEGQQITKRQIGTKPLIIKCREPY